MSAARPDPNDPDATPDLPCQTVEYHAPVTPPPAVGHQAPTPGAVHVRREAEPTVVRRRPARRFSPTLPSAQTDRQQTSVPVWVGGILAVVAGSLVGWALSAGFDSGQRSDAPPKVEQALPAAAAVQTAKKASERPPRAAHDERPDEQAQGRGFGADAPKPAASSRTVDPLRVGAKAIEPPSPKPHRSATNRVRNASPAPTSITTGRVESERGEGEQAVEAPIRREPDDETPREATVETTTASAQPPPSAQPAAARDESPRSWLSDSKPKAWVK